MRQQVIELLSGAIHDTGDTGGPVLTWEESRLLATEAVSALLLSGDHVFAGGEIRKIQRVDSQNGEAYSWTAYTVES